MNRARWMTLNRRTICCGGGERLEVGTVAFRDPSMRLTCCQSMVHAEELGLHLDRRYNPAGWFLAPRRIAGRIARTWRLNRRRIVTGCVASVAVLMAAHHPADFTSAQAAAQMPTTVSGAPTVPAVGSRPGEPRSATIPANEECQP